MIWHPAARAAAIRYRHARLVERAIERATNRVLVASLVAAALAVFVGTIQ